MCCKQSYVVSHELTTKILCNESELWCSYFYDKNNQQTIPL